VNTTQISKIRNFSIIAHVDHGKSTLADRIINMCGGLTDREMVDQVLDSMPLEREKGITIKAQTVRLHHSYQGQTYELNLIDTPGHVDFAYEVSRSLAACESSLLLIDAAQGIQAQTLANLYKAIENNHTILPVYNKIDLPACDIPNVEKQIHDLIGLDTSNAVCVSGKTGEGVGILLDKIISCFPPPKSYDDNALFALIVDSWYDKYLGVIALVRVFAGVLKKGQNVRFIATNSHHCIDNVGFFTPKKNLVDQLLPGQIGFITAKIKNIADCKVGDTIVEANNFKVQPLPGFKEQNSVVFCGFYPTEKTEFSELRRALEKLKLNDSSFHFEEQSSLALGFGFKCGFLGLLHLEIIQERLDREFDISVIVTAPSVACKVYMRDKSSKLIYDPANFPDVTIIDFIEEPIAKVTIITPEQFVGPIITLCIDKRGRQVSLEYVGKNVMLTYLIPLNEIIFNFSNKVKGVSKGYASFDWEVKEYQKADLVKLDILVNSQLVEELSIVIHSSQAERRGRELILKLKELIPQQLFQIAIQAAIGGKIIARENVSALKKNVLAKCYGGDITRKRKLIEKQKAGKKRMRSVGNVDIPQNAFIDALKID
jgi:GTP-binding protein LepA